MGGPPRSRWTAVLAIAVVAAAAIRVDGKPQTKCSVSEFTCSSATAAAAAVASSSSSSDDDDNAVVPHCVPSIRYCDGRRDCPDGSDEPQHCTREYDTRSGAVLARDSGGLNLDFPWFLDIYPTLTYHGNAQNRSWKWASNQHWRQNFQDKLALTRILTHPLLENCKSQGSKYPSSSRYWFESFSYAEIKGLGKLSPSKHLPPQQRNVAKIVY